MCAACPSCCTIAHKQTLASAQFNATYSGHAQHTVALTQCRGQLVQPLTGWWRKQPAHQLHGVLRKPIHPAFHSIHNRTHSSGKSIHQGFTSHPLHNFTDIDQMKLSAAFACWRIDTHITFITAHPRMIINAPFTDVLRRRVIVT